MAQFFDMQLTFLTFLAFLASMMSLDKKRENRNYTLVVISLLLFISTFTLIPYLEYKSAMDNITAFHNGKSLICNTSNYNFTNQEFLLDNKQWSLKGYEFVRNENGLIIKAHMCDVK